MKKIYISIMISTEEIEELTVTKGKPGKCVFAGMIFEPKKEKIDVFSKGFGIFLTDAIKQLAPEIKTRRG